MTRYLPSFTDVLYARQRLAPHLLRTPLERAFSLGAHVWLKLENANPTHSFKIRGALNSVLRLAETLSPQERQHGILAASSGNHAQAIAYASAIAGLPARIYMPQHTPAKKVEGVRAYGAEPILFGTTYDEAEDEALRLAQVHSLPFISAYNHVDVIAGAGTVGLELVEQVPAVQRVLVCASGGGLLSGVGLAVRALAPQAHIIAVCAESAPALWNAFYQQERPQVWDTLAEALSGKIEEGSITLDLLPQVVDEVVLVSESAIADAMRYLARLGWIAEGGGAVSVAALLSGIVPDDGRVTVATVSGGNVDYDAYVRLLNQA